MHFARTESRSTLMLFLRSVTLLMMLYLRPLLVLLLLVLLLLRHSRVRDERRIGNFFAEGVKNLLPVSVEVAFDLVDGLVLDDPELALGIADQPLVVRNDDHAAWRQKMQFW